MFLLTTGYDGVYVPLLVDDLGDFMSAFASHDFTGFSVTIPHKESALKLAAAVDPVAAQIGACNTLIRQEDGTYKGYNTDWLAAICAVERGFDAVTDSSSASTSGGAGDSQRSSGVLQGKSVVVLGAGGAGRALAFGAAARGARVMIANRNRARAEALAAAVPGGAEVVDWDALQRGEVSGDVLANTTSVGMVPNVHETPVPAEAVGKVSSCSNRRVWCLQ